MGEGEAFEVIMDNINPIDLNLIEELINNNQWKEKAQRKNMILGRQNLKLVFGTFF